MNPSFLDKEKKLVADNISEGLAKCSDPYLNFLWVFILWGIIILCCDAHIYPFLLVVMGVVCDCVCRVALASLVPPI
jgi:hypothetical protein